MAEHFNGLTPAEAERLTVLAEECAEVIMAIAKIQRHGFASHNPDDPTHIDNRWQLGQEMGDLYSALDMVLPDVNEPAVRSRAIAKPGKRARYMHHQEPTTAPQRQERTNG